MKYLEISSLIITLLSSTAQSIPTNNNRFSILRKVEEYNAIKNGALSDPPLVQSCPAVKVPDVSEAFTSSDDGVSEVKPAVLERFVDKLVEIDPFGLKANENHVIKGAQDLGGVGGALTGAFAALTYSVGKPIPKQAAIALAGAAAGSVAMRAGLGKLSECVLDFSEREREYFPRAKPSIISDSINDKLRANGAGILAPHDSYFVRTAQNGGSLFGGLVGAAGASFLTHGRIPIAAGAAAGAVSCRAAYAAFAEYLEEHKKECDARDSEE